MKILIATDSYKGSLTSAEAAGAMAEGIRRVDPAAKIRIIETADGGEGTVRAVLAARGGTLIRKTVTGPMGESADAEYGLLADATAVIEMAAASGLTLVAPERRDVMRATTFGTGELIRDAMDHGCRKIYVGIGGSATNDGGVGMAQALGVSFADQAGAEAGFGGGALAEIRRIDMSGRDPRLAETEIIVMSDVTNPLCGKQGASAVFGPQKGADRSQVRVLDENLAHLADLIRRDLGVSVRDVPGAGAAGGLGAGLIAFAGAEIRSGIGAILSLSGFREAARQADLIITGEGRADAQSACGKVISGVAANAEGRPVAVVAGCIGEGAEALYGLGVCAIESATVRPMPPGEAMEKEGSLARVADAAERLMRALRAGAGLNAS